MPLSQSARIAPKRPAKPTYPANHKAAMRVPKGGSSCASCRFLGHDRETCTNTHFIKWNRGSDQLPYPDDEYCSDWYEPNKNAFD